MTSQSTVIRKEIVRRLNRRCVQDMFTFVLVSAPLSSVSTMCHRTNVGVRRYAACLLLISKKKKEKKKKKRLNDIYLNSSNSSRMQQTQVLSRLTVMAEILEAINVGLLLLPLRWHQTASLPTAYHG